MHGRRFLRPLLGRICGPLVGLLGVVQPLLVHGRRFLRPLLKRSSGLLRPLLGRICGPLVGLLGVVQPLLVHGRRFLRPLLGCVYFTEMLNFGLSVFLLQIAKFLSVRNCRVF